MQSCLNTSTEDLEQIYLKECLTPDDQKVFGSIINKHHSYVKHVVTPTRRIHWLVYNKNEPVGAIGINSCVMNLSPRDNLLGFKSNKGRLHGLKNLANNYRFCLINEKCPKNTASRVLKLMREKAPLAWRRKYGNKLCGIETFVGNGLKGSCYLADNWSYLGETKGWSMNRLPKKLMTKEHYERRMAMQNGRVLATRTDPKKIFFTGLNENRAKYAKRMAAHLTPTINRKYLVDNPA